MIIFGTRATRIAPFYAGHDCPSCQSPNSIVLVPWQRYFHIFWIPIFPTSKGFEIVCDKCGATYHPSRFPVSPQARNQVKTPKWTFLGLIAIPLLIGGFMFLGFTQSNKNQAAMVQYIENPSIGDIYEMEFGTKNFSIAKVAEVTPDSIYLYHNEYTVNRKSGLKNFVTKYRNNFNEKEMEGFSKEELKNKAKYHTLIKIHR